MSRYPDDPLARFYYAQLREHGGHWQDNGVYLADCPFCDAGSGGRASKLVVTLNPASFFHGYFRCLSRCMPGGFAHYFAALAGVPPETVPGYAPAEPGQSRAFDFPLANSNDEMTSCCRRLTEAPLGQFQQLTISAEVLAENQVGYNGRYITYPYLQADGNCYAIRCVHPDRGDDFFWQGDEQFYQDRYQLFNLADIGRCAGGALFLVEGELEVLVVKQLGYPAMAVPHHRVFEAIPAELFQQLSTVFVLVKNSTEAMSAARELAVHLGFKVRILSWPATAAKGFSVCDLARENGTALRRVFAKMIRNSSAYSPFVSAEREFLQFQQRLTAKNCSAHGALGSGFPLFDAALGGVHGINVIGGAPKVGKSAFAIQVAGQMAQAGVPVLYYDFENGRQQVYQRILSRLSRLEVKQLGSNGLESQEQATYDAALDTFRGMLDSCRVINDRKLTPELMRRHVDFLRHETRRDQVVVVIDSLHKLPFKDFSERRTGIDAWLRELESIRDELQVSFLVISELSRGTEQAYSEKPHLGIFKGSGDIEYSADNALVLVNESGAQATGHGNRSCVLHVVASREHSPGAVARYTLDYPFWGFVEEPLAGEF